MMVRIGARWPGIAQAVAGSAGTIGLRGLSIASNILVASLALRLLGADRYGQYVLLMTTAAWLAIGMLGTTEYLTQALVKVPGGAGSEQAIPLLRANLVYNAIGAAGAAVIALLGLTGLALVMPLDRQLVAAATILLLGSALSQPLSMASSALIAQGRIGTDALFKILQPLLLLAIVGGAYLLPPMPQGRMLILLSIAYALSWLVTRACAFLLTFQGIALLHRLCSADIGPVARSAWPFLVIQIAALLSFQTDRFLVTGFSSLAELTRYDLLSRIFTALYAVFSIPILHIWRLVGSERDGHNPDRRKVIGLYLMGSIVFWIATTLVVMVSTPLVIRLFSGNTISALPWTVTALVGAFFLVRGTTDVLTLSLYALEQQKTLLPFIIAHGVTNVAFAAAGGALGGINGLLIGQIVSFVLSTLIPFLWILHHRLGKAATS